ncbi:tRNA threonylcarbamoyladenosine biosynthesis protein TsaE, partial [hydrothermal vent metagenome]
MNTRLNSLEEMEVFAVSFIKTLSKKKKEMGAFVVGLQGDLGAGKTAFTKSVAKALGVGVSVTSPTFVIEKIYKLPVRAPHAGGPENEIFSRLIHIDAYRLESGSELTSLGWEDISSDPKNIILIEWPEKV